MENLIILQGVRSKGEESSKMRSCNGGVLLIEKGTQESGQHTAKAIGHPISFTLLLGICLRKNSVKGNSCMVLSNSDIIY